MSGGWGEGRVSILSVAFSLGGLELLIACLSCMTIDHAPLRDENYYLEKCCRRYSLSLIVNSLAFGAVHGSGGLHGACGEATTRRVHAVHGPRHKRHRAQL